MERLQWITAVLLGTALTVGLAGSATATEGREGATWDNWRPDGTYVLKTNDLRSIQAYYRDVGMGPLRIARDGGSADMRETCLLLGKDWRPLGHVPVPRDGGREPWKFELCYYDAPNPDELAQAKCANLSLALQENRRARREIVCAPRKAVPAMKESA